jgi:hypothetical protein
MSGGRKGKWGIAVAALVVVTALLATGWLNRSPPQEVAASSPSLIPAPHVTEPRHHVSREAIPAAGAVSTHAPPAIPANNLEACGLPKSRPADTDTDADAEAVNGGVIEATQETHDRWKAALLDSPDTRARAVGLLLQRFEWLRGDSAVQAEESRDELVQLAAGGGDPALYAIAVGLCEKHEPDVVVTMGACRRISLTEWARNDPSNAMPWIALAQAARARGDSQAEAAAFSRGAGARKLRSPGDSMVQFGLQEIPVDAPAAAKFSFSVELIGYEVSFLGPELSEVMRYCSVAAVKQAQTRKDCSAVAELLVGPETTLLYLSLGAKLGERVGWAAERVQQLSVEKEKLLQLIAGNGMVPTSCEAVSRINTYIDDRVRMGEVAALGELENQRVHSGLPVSH